MGRSRSARDALEHAVSRALHGAPTDQRADRDARNAAAFDGESDLVDREDRPDRDIGIAGGDHDHIGLIDRLDHARCGSRLWRPRVVNRVDLVPVTARDEPGLEGKRPRRCLDEGAQWVVGGRK